jgi:hypothetical protein
MQRQKETEEERRKRNALNVRRFNWHRKGDHSLCIPNNCPEATKAWELENGFGAIVVDGPEGDRPFADGNEIDGLEEGFSPNAQRFWDDLPKMGIDIDATIRPIAIEVCRIIGRLDKLDRQLRGNDDRWLRIYKKRGTDEINNEYIVVVDKALAEAREQAGALTRGVSEIRQLIAVQRKHSSPTLKDQPILPAGIKGLKDELSARRGKTAS